MTAREERYIAASRHRFLVLRRKAREAQRSVERQAHKVFKPGQAIVYLWGAIEIHATIQVVSTTCDVRLLVEGRTGRTRWIDAFAVKWVRDFEVAR